MDLIGSIKLIENTLGRRYPNQPKSNSAPKNKLHDVAKKKNPQVDHDQLTAWDEIQLGRNIDAIV